MAAPPHAAPVAHPASAAAGATGDDEQKERLEIYKLMVEMADRVSQRRQTANSFYLSVDTLLVSGSAYIGATAPNLKNAMIITAAGVATSLLWVRGIESYRSLNNAKFVVIQGIEQRLCEKPYTDEWARIDPALHDKKHRPFHSTERFVPFLFMAVFVIEGISLLPWRDLIGNLTAFVRSATCP